MYSVGDSKSSVMNVVLETINFNPDVRMRTSHHQPRAFL